MRASRTDECHKSIVTALRQVGCVVWDTSRAGGGAPDLVVLNRRAGILVFLELKVAKGKLNPLQKKWHDEWWGYVSVVRSVDEALKVVGVKT